MAWPTTPVATAAGAGTPYSFGDEAGEGGGAAPPTTGQLWPRGNPS